MCCWTTKADKSFDLLKAMRLPWAVFDGMMHVEELFAAVISSSFSLLTPPLLAPCVTPLGPTLSNLHVVCLSQICPCWPA